MKLELGSGDRPTPGYVHMDIRRHAPDVDIVGDVTNLDSYLVLHTTDNLGAPYEEIRATHLLEHISHRDTVKVLKHWREHLEPSGVLYIEVPCLTGHVEAWEAGKETDEDLVWFLFGEQDHEHNYHRTMFTQRSLARALSLAGFEDVNVRDIGCVLIAIARNPS